ncbi:GAF and ANTAR domain-containing protein [Frondihabitans cladoniiphilus]|uniref:GAF domain-containing protein n=1 Tax=Frondihabitans cladoniiphilus TaxID=715785 RepID=A0ABP8W7E7_9MICO
MSLVPESNDALDRWAKAVGSITDTPSATWTSPFIGLLAADGASVATFGDILGSETLWSSGPVAARLDEAQFDLGEGPAWDALRTRTPILVRAVDDPMMLLWPAFVSSAEHDHVKGLFVFPLLIGPFSLGAISVFTLTRATLSSEQVTLMMRVAEAQARSVLRFAVGQAADESESDDGRRHSRRAVHQATGFIISQLGLSAADAYLVLQGRAFADERSMSDLSDDVIHGRVEFTTNQNGIEDAS